MLVQLEKYKSQLDPEVLNFVTNNGKVPDTQLFMVAAGNMGGQMTESSAEAFHKMRQPVRSLEIFGNVFSLLYLC